MHCGDMGASENSCGKRVPARKAPAMQAIIRTTLQRLRGLLIISSIMKPTQHRSTVQAVETSGSGIPLDMASAENPNTAAQSVIPAGAAVLRTLNRKLPLILSLHGASARKKPGMPMVKAATSVTCVGCMG